MAFSISAVVLFGALLALLVRFKALGLGSAMVGVLFGYYLARSDAAPTVDQLMDAISGTVGSL